MSSRNRSKSRQDREKEEKQTFKDQKGSGDRFKVYFTDGCKKNEFYIREGGSEKYFYLDENGGFFDEYGQYHDKNGDMTRRPRQIKIKPASKQYFGQKKLSKSGLTFTVSDSRFRYVIDEDGGWYDEYGHYYDHNGEYIEQGRFKKSERQSDGRRQQDSRRQSDNRRQYKRSDKQEEQKEEEDDDDGSEDDSEDVKDRSFKDKRNYNRGDDGRNDRRKYSSKYSEYEKRRTPDEWLQSILAQSEDNKRIKQYKELFESLKKVLEKNGLESEIYGSYLTGTQQKDSDLDVTVLTKSRFEFDERSVLEQIYGYLRGELKHLSYEKVLGQQVKVPLISIEDRKRGLQVEITLNNLMGLANSSLLRKYVEIHPKVKQVILLVKYWAKSNQVISKTRMSSFAVSLMVIFYLQQSKYLPVLQELNQQQKKITLKKFVLGQEQQFEYNAWFESDDESIKSASDLERLEKTSLLSIFQQFFAFYGEAENQTIIIDISKSAKEQAVYKSDVFDIRDPFDPIFRPGSRPFGLFDKRYVRGAFENALLLLKEKKDENYKKLLAPSGRKSKQRFEAFINKEEIEEGLKSGEIFEGTFEGLGNSPIAYISSKDEKFANCKIKVPNRSAQNRALHKDKVYFRILNETEHIDVHDDPHSQLTEEEQHHATIHYAEVLAIKTFYWKAKPIVGHIVRRDKFLDYEPLNKKLPKFSVKQNQKYFNQFLIQNDLHKNELEQKYFSGIYQDWGNDAFSPTIDLTTVLGDIDNIELNCEILLQVNEVYNEPFFPETEAEMLKYHEFVKDGVYIIPESEKTKRKDFDLRSHIICTIDPVTARDLDDALSVKKLEDDLYEVGVHIADVSYFVREQTKVDEDASLRTTSVYLVHRVIAMLPRLLCEELCSLNPSQDRLAFSVFFQMRSNGDIIWDKNVRYGKSIIRSCAKFSYDIVQQIFDGKLKDLKNLPASVGYDPKQVDENTLIDCLQMLKLLGLNRREKRLQSGALTFEKKKLRFTLDQDFLPLNFQVDERNQAMFVVEEFMLLANQFVAIKLVDTCRKVALLRNHPFPKEEKIKKFTDALQFYGKTVDFTNYQTLKTTLDLVMKDPKMDDGTKSNLQQMMIMILEQARYLIVQDSEEPSWHHFALNFARYTHFTSPIRRYPDLLVHRLLEKALIHGPKMENEVNSQYMIDLMDACNEKKMNARRVSDGCEKIFMALYLKNHLKVTHATVIELSKSNSARFIKVYVKEYDIQVTFDFTHVSTVKDLKVIPDEQNSQYIKYVVTYQLSQQQTPQTITFSQFCPLEVVVTASDDFPIDYKLKIVLKDDVDTNKILYLC